MKKTVATVIPFKLRALSRNTQIGFAIFSSILCLLCVGVLQRETVSDTTSSVEPRVAIWAKSSDHLAYHKGRPVALQREIQVNHVSTDFVASTGRQAGGRTARCTQKKILGACVVQLSTSFSAFTYTGPDALSQARQSCASLVVQCKNQVDRSACGGRSGGRPKCRFCRKGKLKNPIQSAQTLSARMDRVCKSACKLSNPTTASCSATSTTSYLFYQQAQ